MSFKFVFMPSFERSLRKLKKRYRNINTDVKEALSSVEANSKIGDIIPEDYDVRKLRVASRDMQRGKTGGFPLLYKLSNEEDVEDLLVYLLFIYAKTDQEDVAKSFLEGLADLSDLSDDNELDGPEREGDN